MARAASFASAGSVVAVPTVRGHATPVSATGAICAGAARSGPSCGAMLPSARSAAAATRRPASRPPTISDSSRAQTVQRLARSSGSMVAVHLPARHPDCSGGVTPQARESTSSATVLCRTPRMRGIAHPRWRLTGSVRFREPGGRRWSSSAGGTGQMPDNDQRRGVEARGADHSGAARGRGVRIGRTAVTGWALASVLVVAGFGTAMGATPVAVAQPVAVADATDTSRDPRRGCRPRPPRPAAYGRSGQPVRGTAGPADDRPGALAGRHRDRCTAGRYGRRHRLGPRGPAAPGRVHRRTPRTSAPPPPSGRRSPRSGSRTSGAATGPPTATPASTARA